MSWKERVFTCNLAVVAYSLFYRPQADELPSLRRQDSDLRSDLETLAAEMHASVERQASGLQSWEHDISGVRSWTGGLDINSRLKRLEEIAHEQSRKDTTDELTFKSQLLANDVEMLKYKTSDLTFLSHTVHDVKKKKSKQMEKIIVEAIEEFTEKLEALKGSETRYNACLDTILIVLKPDSMSVYAILSGLLKTGTKQALFVC